MDEGHIPLHGSVCFMKTWNRIFYFSNWTWYFCHLQVNLVDWLKMMVASRRSEEVVDPTIETRPSTRALKRALLTALRCVDPDSEKRPKMGQVVRMLESDDPIPRGVCTIRKGKKVPFEFIVHIMLALILYSTQSSYIILIDPWFLSYWKYKFSQAGQKI